MSLILLDGTSIYIVHFKYKPTFGDTQRQKIRQIGLLSTLPTQTAERGDSSMYLVVLVFHHISY